MSNCSHEAWDFGALQCPDCGAVKGHVADADYAKLEAEAQALREEVAALRARVAVVPGRLPRREDQSESAQEGRRWGMSEEKKPIAWLVEFESGDRELWLASEFDGEPAFGRWITPLYAGETVDQEPEE
ncbi:hypothetical protein [Pseudomonas aeruginosa]|uniref:hypothetical protein n=2 Tax=Pseudomonas aeruginosa TaxID=287 RepID=UPI003D042C0C